MEEIEKCILGLLDGGQGRFTIPDVIGDVAANERQVREAISDLRKRGILIIKDQFGFYRLAQVVVLACVDQVAEIGWSSVVHFVVPFDEVKVRGIDITQRDPMLYRGRLAGWIERWDVIDDLIEMGCNHWQMALPII